MTRREKGVKRTKRFWSRKRKTNKECINGSVAIPRRIWDYILLVHWFGGRVRGWEVFFGSQRLVLTAPALFLSGGVPTPNVDITDRFAASFQAQLRRVQNARTCGSFFRVRTCQTRDFKQKMTGLLQTATQRLLAGRRVESPWTKTKPVP